ncbi:MAG TPA: NUDIX domain-containing protein [Candidatus Poseidoniales archaeon]|nr:NUDIX domain-containing protein [Candidatus Poseidoniales archaeon]
MTGTILVTGFGSFPDQSVNPTEMALGELPLMTGGDVSLCTHGGAQTGSCGVFDSSAEYRVQIETQALSVDAEGAMAVTERLESGERWDAIVLTGVDGKANYPRTELTATNHLNFHLPDVQNRIALGPVVDGAPKTIRAHDVVKRLCTGLPEVWSNLQQIGTYVCNETFFLTLECCRRLNLDIPVIFLHVPDAEPQEVARWMEWWVARLGRPPRTVVAGVALRRSDGAIFAAHRRDYPLDDGWEFPGGKRRVGESLNRTAIREAREELGVHLSPGIPLGIVCGEVERREYELHVFEHECEAEPLLGHDHDQGRWLEPSQLFEVPWLDLDLPLVRALSQA